MSRKKILITGASTGFGNITAKLLAENGHTVYASMRDLNGKNKAHKDALLDWARSHQADLRVVELDVTQEKSVDEAKNLILTETNGRIDVVINNAGIYGSGIQEAFTLENHQALFDVNVFGTIRVNNAFLPTLRKQGSGLIIQTSSILGRVVVPFGGPYDATKWAVEALSENLAYELKPLGIDVAIVQPGVFLTELFQKIYSPSHPEVANEYGKSAELYQATLQSVAGMLSDPNFPNRPEHVAEAIVKLVEMPDGTRPLRTVVDKVMGGVADIINETSRQVQAGVLQSFGFGELNIGDKKAPKILRLDSSSRYAHSASRQLTDHLIERLQQEYPGSSLKTRDLAGSIPLPTEAYVDGSLYSMQSPSPAMKAATQLSDELVAELIDADVIVLGLPVYNWTFNSTFKAYVDQISRLGVTFEYLEDGTTRGKLRAHTIYIVFTSGGTAIDSEKDFATPYLKFLWNKLGIPNVKFIEATDLLGNPEKTLSDAKAQIDQLLLPAYA